MKFIIAMFALSMLPFRPEYSLAQGPAASGVKVCSQASGVCYPGQIVTVRGTLDKVEVKQDLFGTLYGYDLVLTENSKQRVLVQWGSYIHGLGNLKETPRAGETYSVVGVRFEFGGKPVVAGRALVNSREDVRLPHLNNSIFWLEDIP